MIPRRLIQRILARCVFDNGCLIYTGNPSRRYPYIYDGTRYRPVHHLVWEYHHGSRNGLDVLHSCDHPRCVQHTHLHLGTHAQNMQEMAERGRSMKGRLRVTHCRNGHEYTPENTGSNGRGRACLACHAERERRRRRGT